MENSQRKQILMGAGYAFGIAGTLMPRVVLKTFGYGDASGELEAMTRAYSARNIALAAVLHMTGDSRQLKRFNTVAAALFVADTVSTVWAAAKGKLSWRAAVSLLPVTTGLAAVAAGGADIGG